jgi:hypothetical protein
MSGDDIAQRVARTGDFLKRIDTNGNGTIDAEEAKDPNAKQMLDRIFSRIGKEQRYPVAISEILQGYEAYYRAQAAGNASQQGSNFPQRDPRGNYPQPGYSQPTPPAGGLTSPAGFGFTSPAPAPPTNGYFPRQFDNRPAAPTYSPTSFIIPTGPPAAGALATSSSAAASLADSKPVPRKPSKFATAADRLPKGLPDWFIKKEVNGQVTMAEYATNWTAEKVQEFDRYDLNHDGIITAAECLQVEKGKSGSK